MNFQTHSLILICFVSLSLSPPCRLDDSAEDLDVTMISRKTFFYLIGTLNASFAPDVDFNDCRGEDFSKEKSIQVSLTRERECVCVSYLIMQKIERVLKIKNEKERN